MSDEIMNYKLVVIGKSAVGKSAIMIRFTDDRFVENYLTTIGVDFKFRSLKINNDNFRLQIWDTAGQEKYQSITKTFYKGAHAVILVFDLTSKKSYEEMKDIWLEESIKSCDPDVQFVIFGNKKDLESKREVTKEEVMNFIKDKDILYFETSAKSGENVENAFFKITEKIHEKQKNSIEKTQQPFGSSLEEANLNKKQSGCCS
jgi:Ras-related protein Rab-1A